MRRDIFARRGVGVIVEVILEVILGCGHGSKRNGREAGRFAAVAQTRNETDDFRAHDTPSNTAIPIRNISASEIRYTVIHCSSLKKMRGTIAIGTIISGANPIPWEYGGRGRAHKSARPAGTFARAG
jgi:hypothetical protein